MEEFALQVVGSSIIPLASLGFRWLETMAESLYYSIARWWGGSQKKHKVWNAYKAVRDEMMRKETNNDIRLALLQDIRTEFRVTYPAYANLWN